MTALIYNLHLLAIMGPLSTMCHMLIGFSTASMAAITAILVSLLGKTSLVSEAACDCPIGNTGGDE